MRIKGCFCKKISHFYLALMHILAMITPFGRLKRSFYRLRGTKIGKNVDISGFVFLEESYPELISIEDNVDIGPKVTIVTHDSSLRCLNPSLNTQYGSVLIKKNVYVGACAIILPGVKVGEFSIIAAGAVVSRDVDPYTIVAGIPAKKIGMVQDKLSGYSGNLQKK